MPPVDQPPGVGCSSACRLLTVSCRFWHSLPACCDRSPPVSDSRDEVPPRVTRRRPSAAHTSRLGADGPPATKHLPVTGGKWVGAGGRLTPLSCGRERTELTCAAPPLRQTPAPGEAGIEANRAETPARRRNFGAGLTPASGGRISGGLARPRNPCQTSSTGAKFSEIPRQRQVIGQRERNESYETRPISFLTMISNTSCFASISATHMH